MTAFNLKKYFELQTIEIKNRIKQFNNKLYLEFGGKIFDDLHASRVLPGFLSDSKLQLLLKLKNEAEIVVVISANDIENNKLRGDLGIKYEDDVLRLIDNFKSYDLIVNNVVITQYQSTFRVNKLQNILSEHNINVVKHYKIDDYPNNLDLIVSKNGYGKNETIKTQKPLIVITAPGPGSGKLAVALSELYHDAINNIDSGYAKFETFPVWNLAVDHPLNLAYEAATTDLNDQNKIDPYYLKSRNKIATNYNRDIQAFPILSQIMNKIQKRNIYDSPTSMGVNMVGFCFNNEEEIKQAANKEIIRRYYQSAVAFKKGMISKSVLIRNANLISKNNIDFSIRPCIEIANKLANQLNMNITTFTLNNNINITGKTSALLGSSSAALLNALKYLANIPKEIHLLSKEAIELVQNLKVNVFKSKNPRLHMNETLIILAMSAKSNQYAKLAYDQLKNLAGIEAHCSAILSMQDIETYNHLNINITQEPKYDNDTLYHK